MSALLINTYSGAWQRALTPPPTAPKIGSLVRIHDNPDAREIDDFRACLSAAGLALKWQRTFPRLRMDAYRITKAA